MLPPRNRQPRINLQILPTLLPIIKLHWRTMFLRCKYACGDLLMTPVQHVRGGSGLYPKKPTPPPPPPGFYENKALNPFAKI